ASMLPTPKTTFFREAAKCGHLTQLIARVRRSAKAAALASGESDATVIGVSAGGVGKRAAGLTTGFSTAAGAGAGITTACLMAGAGEGAILVGAGAGLAGRGPLVNAVKPSGCTETNRTPRAFNPCKCCIVASSNWL